MSNRILEYFRLRTHYPPDKEYSQDNSYIPEYWIHLHVSHCQILKLDIIEKNFKRPSQYSEWSLLFKPDIFKEIYKNIISIWDTQFILLFP